MASSQVSSGKKRFVHIRDLTFHPSTLKCSIGDLIIFIHDGEAEETHSLCIPEVANSPILKKGQSFMKVIIRVKVTSSLTSTPSQPSINTTERYADSFVYAAANNQISIVRRRLGLDEVTGRKRVDSNFQSEQALALISSLDAIDSDGFTALGAAARSGHLDVVALLLDQGALVDFSNKGGDTALHLAANWGKSEVVMLLLRHNANVHSVNELLRTPLHLATFNGHQIAVDMILKYGTPDPHVGDYSGKTAFEIAVDFGTSRLEIAHALKNYAKHVYAPNIVSILTCVERQQISSNSLASSFEYLSQLNTGALSLISRFLACQQVAVIDALAATEKRLGIQSTRGGNLASSSNERFAVFSPLRKFDPRSRSLPYLLRQADIEADRRAVEDINAAVLAADISTDTGLTTE